MFSIKFLKLVLPIATATSLTMVTTFLISASKKSIDKSIKESNLTLINFEREIDEFEEKKIEYPEEEKETKDSSKDKGGSEKEKKSSKPEERGKGTFSIPAKKDSLPKKELKPGDEEHALVTKEGQILVASDETREAEERNGSKEEKITEVHEEVDLQDIIQETQANEHLMQDDDSDAIKVTVEQQEELPSSPTQGDENSLLNSESQAEGEYSSEFEHSGRKDPVNKKENLLSGGGDSSIEVSEKEEQVDDHGGSEDSKLDLDLLKSLQDKLSSSRDSLSSILERISSFG